MEVSLCPNEWPLEIKLVNKPVICFVLRKSKSRVSMDWTPISLSPMTKLFSGSRITAGTLVEVPSS